MSFLGGIRYNLRGFHLGLKTPKLLLLGILRFAVLLLFALIGAALVLSAHDRMLALVWQRPESVWLVWLWHLVSWLTALLMVGAVSLLAYLVSQIFFNVVVMDAMSRATERMVRGGLSEGSNASLFRQLFFLIRQEVPRAVLPMVCLFLITVLGWFTPLAPLLSVLAPILAAVFLAWDHTDLLPARRMLPLSTRFSMLMKTLPFHLGFGLPFLIPVVNIALLSFAPVGGTLFHLEHRRGIAAGYGRQTSENFIA